MLNIKLGFAALALEAAAWSSSWLLAEHSDAALASYLLMHAGASVLLSLVLLSLLPPRLSHPRWAALLLMIVCSYAVPVAGFAGVVTAFVVLRLYRRGTHAQEFDTVDVPEFDQHQRRHNQFSHAGMRSFLSNAQVPDQTRMRAMAALQYVGGRTASPLLRSVLHDPSEDLRLLAYGLLDNLEKRINQAIDQELDALQNAGAHGAARLQSTQRLSELYWELVYQGLAQGDLRKHALHEALRFCDRALQEDGAQAALHLRRGRLLHALGESQPVLQAYAQARALGLPATRVLPYEAQLHFEQRDFAQARGLMAQLGPWDALPRLRPVIDYWNQP